MRLENFQERSQSIRLWVLVNTVLGKNIGTFFISKQDSDHYDILPSHIILNPGDNISIAAATASGASDSSASLTWRELI